MYRWSEQEIIDALQDFVEREGHRPTWEDVSCRARKLRLPHVSAIYRECGSWANAQILAFGEAVPQGGQNDKDEDTRAVIEALAQGATLVELGRERGISGQALGRRVNRYQRTFGLPVVKRRPGARSSRLLASA